MSHLRNISRNRPAEAQAGGISFLEKVASIQAVFSLAVFLRCDVGVNLLGKDACGDSSE